MIEQSRQQLILSFHDQVMKVAEKIITFLEVNIGPLFD